MLTKTHANHLLGTLAEREAFKGIALFDVAGFVKEEPRGATAPADHCSEAPASKPAGADAFPDSPVDVLIIDPRVADFTRIVAAARPDVKVVVLDPEQDGIDQITVALKRLQYAGEVEVLAHGAYGKVLLGRTWVNSDVLALRAAEIAAWAGHVADDADVVIYGCDAARNDDGHLFVNTLASLLQHMTFRCANAVQPPVQFAS